MHLRSRNRSPGDNTSNRALQSMSSTQISGSTNLFSGGGSTPTTNATTSNMSSLDSGGSSGVGNNLVFCVSPTLFECCGCLLDVPSGMTLSMIYKLRSESATSTTISFMDWREIATSVMGIKDPTASNLFDTFYVLSLKVENRVESSRVLLGRMGGTVDEAKYRAASSSRTVSLPGFTLFLMAQLLLERPPRQQLAGEISSDQILTFVKQHLHDMVSAAAVTKPGRLSLTDVSSDLQLLLREFANGSEQPFGTNVGFLWPRGEKTIDTSVLCQFLRPRIVMPSDVKASFPNNIAIRNLTSTVQLLPSPLGAQPTRFPGASFKISKCSQTSFYITSILPHTLLSGCVNCTIAMGSVSGLLYIDRCEQCQIVAMCSGVVISNSRNVTLFICSNTPPVLNLGDGNQTLENVKIAPYNSHYSTLEEHVTASGLNPKMNLWKCNIPQSMILPSDQFYSVAFPIAPQTTAVITTRTNPCPLPKEYADALTTRVQTFNQVSSSLQSAYKQLDAAGRHDLAEALRAKVQSMFLDWVYESGQAKPLMEIMTQPPHLKQ